jgi:hypothetical protein
MAHSVSQVELNICSSPDRPFVSLSDKGTRRSSDAREHDSDMDPFITIDGPQLAMSMVADTQPYIQTSEHMDVDTLAPSRPVLVAQPSASSLCATGISDVSPFSSFASSGVQSHPTQDSAFARFLPDDGILYDRHGNPVSFTSYAFSTIRDHFTTALSHSRCLTRSIASPYAIISESLAPPPRCRGVCSDQALSQRMDQLSEP